MEQRRFDQKSWPTTVDSSGRVLLPAELRRAIGVEPGGEMVWMEGEKGLVLRTFDDVLAEIQNYFRAVDPSEELWSESLIRERREEAAREQAEEGGSSID
jgi:antitoxin PrlF